MRLTRFGLLTPLVLACSGSPTAPSPDDVRVELAWVGSGDEGNAARVTLSNIGTVPVAYRCGSLYLEVESGTEWRLAQSPSCVGIPPWITLDTGASYQETFYVGGGHRYRAGAAVARPDGSGLTRLYSEPSEPSP